MRFIFMYKVVEGLVPAVPPQQFLTPIKNNKRRIKPRQFPDCITNNVVERSVINNQRAFEIPRHLTDQYKNSYFVRTIEEWNKLDNCTVNSATLDKFKERISHRD